MKISVSEASALHQMRPTILKLAADVYAEDLLTPLARDGVFTDDDIRAVQQPRDIFDQLIELLERVELRAGGFVGILRALSAAAVDQAPIADELRATRPPALPSSPSSPLRPTNSKEASTAVNQKPPRMCG